MKLEMLSSNCECSCDLVKILLWRSERSRSYRIALESEILKTEQRRLSWILLLNLLEGIIHYHVDAKDANINQHFRIRRCSLRVLFLNFPTILDRWIRGHALSDHHAEGQHSSLVSLTHQRLWSIEWTTKMRMQNFRSTMWQKWQRGLDMRWLDHRPSTSKTEFSFQIISAQIARSRCECLSKQLARCFSDSDIVANSQLQGISACNRYEEKRNVWRS